MVGASLKLLLIGDERGSGKDWQVLTLLPNAFSLLTDGRTGTRRQLSIDAGFRLCKKVSISGRNTSKVPRFLASVEAGLRNPKMLVIYDVFNIIT